MRFLREAARKRSLGTVAGAALILVFVAAGRPSVVADNERIHLTPRFTPGQVVRYEIDLRNVSKGGAEGPIKEPEAASELTESATIVIRLEVLSIDPQPMTELSKIRMRATYERSAAKNESDAYDEQADAIVEQFKKLEGQSVEYTLGADGKISDLAGFEKVFHDPSAIANARSWLTNITPGAGFPKKGIAIGEKWHSEEALAGSPLKGTVWRADSSYLRNEPCRAGGGSSPAGANGSNAPAAAATDSDMCAIVLTQFKILQTSSRGDLTPPDFIHNGLRTSGSWTGSGESLNSISLRTGLVINVTQTSDQQMNFTISSASSPSRMTYAGEVKSQSQIALLPENSAATR
jgi:hypothetical protein